MRVLYADYYYADVALERELLAQAGIEMVEAHCRTVADVMAVGQDADALIMHFAPMTRQLFEGLPKLGLISIAAVGVDLVDLGAAEDLGIWVTNVPDGNTTEVASHALALALSWIRELPSYDRDLAAGNFQYDVGGLLRRPNTLKVGIVGLGRIGQQFFRVAGPVFGDFMAYDPYLPAEAWPTGIQKMDSLAEMLSQVDLVSIHTPLTTETRGMFNAELLGTMKPDSYLINTSRGPVVDTTALIPALDSGQLRAVGLDVFPQEPPAVDDPIRRHPRILCSPHAAFYSTAAEHEMRRKSVENIIQWAQTGRPIYSVVEGRPR